MYNDYNNNFYSYDQFDINKINLDMSEKSSSTNMSNSNLNLKTIPDQENIQNYIYIKNLAKVNNVYDIYKSFYLSLKMGIIRNVEILLPVILSYGNYQLELDDALCVASLKAHTKIMELIIDHGANVNCNSGVPLEEAIKSGSLDAVKLLVKNGAIINVDDDKFLLICCACGDYPDILTFLIEYGVNTSKKYHELYKICIQKNHIESARILIKSNEIIKKSNDEKNNIIIEDDFSEYAEEKYDTSSSSDEFDY